MSYSTVNVLGYLLGASEEYLGTEFWSVDTKDNYVCSVPSEMLHLREICRLRQYLICNSITGKESLYSVCRKGTENYTLMRSLLTPKAGPNPTVLVALRFIEEQVRSLISSDAFASSLPGEDLTALRGLFCVNYPKKVKDVCLRFQLGMNESSAVVIASVLSGRLLTSDKDFYKILRWAQRTFGPPPFVRNGEPQVICMPVSSERTSYSLWVSEPRIAVPSSNFEEGFDISSAKETSIQSIGTYEERTDTRIVASKKIDLKEQVEQLQHLDQFCSRFEKLLVSVDTENFQPDYISGIIARIERITTCNVVLYTREEQCTIASGIELQGESTLEVSVVPRVLGHKNTVDLELVARTVKTAQDNVEYGVVVLSSDSDYTALARCIGPERLCFCCDVRNTSAPYVDILEDLGCTVVIFGSRFLDAEEQYKANITSEYFLATLNRVLPNLRECYNDIILSSPKPAYEDISFFITAEGQLLAKINKQKVVKA